MRVCSHSKSDHFHTDHLSTDLKVRSVRGGAVTIIGQLVKFVLQLTSTALLARLLTPSDFGLVAMVAAVTGFVMLFKDVGLSMATVQKKEINHAQVSTLFWINVLVSTVIMLVAMMIAPLIAWFYGDARLTGITLISALGLLFGGLAVQHQALLKRQMRFRSLVCIDVGSQLGGIVFAVFAAWYGMGYWALVIMQLAVAGFTSAGVWFSCRWRPGLPVRGSGVKDMLAFGGNMTVYSVVNYFARTFDNILIGWHCGAGSLGLYSRAYSLLLLPIGQFVAPVSSVAFPTLSRLQDDPERYSAFYFRAVKMIAYATMPLVSLMVVLADEIVYLLLGSQWLGAVPIFRILAITAIWQPVYCTAGWVYVTQGKTKRMAKWGVASGFLIVLSFVIGLPWGVLGVASGYTVCMTLLLYPNFSYAFDGSPLNTKTLISTVTRPLLLGLAAAIFLTLLKLLYQGSIEPIWILLLIASGCCLMGVICFSYRLYRKDYSEIVSTVRLLAKRSEMSASI